VLYKLEVGPELKRDGIQQYLELIGVLRWAVKLGRVHFLLEASLMSTHMAMPRKGHLQQLYCMFGYLKLYPKRKFAFDFQHPSISERMLKNMTGMIFIETPLKLYQLICQLNLTTPCLHIALSMRGMVAIERQEDRRLGFYCFAIRHRKYGTVNVKTPSKQAPSAVSSRL
jgi:hypothetical protein